MFGVVRARDLRSEYSYSEPSQRGGVRNQNAMEFQSLLEEDLQPEDQSPVCNLQAQTEEALSASLRRVSLDPNQANRERQRLLAAAEAGSLQLEPDPDSALVGTEVYTYPLHGDCQSGKDNRRSVRHITFEDVVEEPGADEESSDVDMVEGCLDELMQGLDPEELWEDVGADLYTTPANQPMESQGTRQATRKDKRRGRGRVTLDLSATAIASLTRLCNATKDSRAKVIEAALKMHMDAMFERQNEGSPGDSGQRRANSQRTITPIKAPHSKRQKLKVRVLWHYVGHCCILYLIWCCVFLLVLAGPSSW